MFRRNKTDKAKLEHKLYLARENPEPVFDLSDCGIHTVPSGIYSLCRVFLKESLHLENNLLTSLSGGGSLKDLHLLRILDLHNNAFSNLPDEVEHLTNLTELYLNDNRIKKLPETLCNLKKLQILDISNNFLKKLPDNLGNLVKIQKLYLLGNNSINSLPKSICKLKYLQKLQLDSRNFIYPPAEVANNNVESVLRYICDDIGVEYAPIDLSEENTDYEGNTDAVDYPEDSIKATIWKLEKIKEDRIQSFLEIEKNNELLQRQEFELAIAGKANREQLLTDLNKQQTKFDSELSRIRQLKDSERFQLIEQLQEAEQNADRAIDLLLSLNKDPSAQLLELERIEEERLLISASKYDEALRKQEVLNAMQELLEQETERFKLHRDMRFEASRSILEQEIQLDSLLTDILHQQDFQKEGLIMQLQENEELQMVMVGALLERGDSRSWGLIQQVRLVESQLGALTTIELDRRKLMMDEHMSDLSEKRCYLSKLLVHLLEQQGERRAQLIAKLRSMEEQENNMTDFWLRKYQQLLESAPTTLTEAQRNLDQNLAQALLMSGVLHCLPFLAHLAQTKGHIQNISEDDIRNAGVTHEEDRQRILEAFKMYSNHNIIAAPSEEASAPPLKQANTSECVICMEVDCEIIFVPCGHLCCCVNCTETLLLCPLCRGTIERKIRVYTN